MADADRSRKELITRGVAAFRTKFPDGPRQVDGLVQLVKDAEDCGVELGSNPYSFIEALCSEDFVRAFLPYAMNDPHPLLAYMTIVTFRWLRGSDLAQYRKVGIEAATHKNRLLALGAADSIASGPNLNAPLVEDVAILELLAQHPDAAVRRLTFTGIRRLGEHAPYEREAIEMLLASEIGDASGMAEEMCGAVDYAGIKKEHLSEKQIHLLLDKLVPTKEIDGHHTERFLAWVGEHFPAALFDFILRRLDRDAEFDRRNEKKAGYSPIPHHRFGNAFRPLQNGPQYRTFLEQVRDRFVTPPELALTRPHFAIHVIEECGRVEAQLGVSAESVLLTNAQTGPFNRASGQPSPKYLSMKERSETLSALFPQGSSGNRVFTRLLDIAVEMLNRERLDDEQMAFE